MFLELALLENLHHGSDPQYRRHPGITLTYGAEIIADCPELLLHSGALVANSTGGRRRTDLDGVHGGEGQPR